jgi:hypothetical protein
MLSGVERTLVTPKISVAVVTALWPFLVVHHASYAASQNARIRRRLLRPDTQTPEHDFGVREPAKIRTAGSSALAQLLQASLREPIQIVRAVSAEGMSQSRLPTGMQTSFNMQREDGSRGNQMAS